MTILECINATHCPACAHENEHEDVLGTLGRMTWIRCRHCGMQYNVKFDFERGKAELAYPVQ